MANGQELVDLMGWRYKARLTFANDSAVGVLTNCPVLVRLGTNYIAGFAYRQVGLTNGATGAAGAGAGPRRSSSTTSGMPTSPWQTSVQRPQPTQATERSRWTKKWESFR